MSATIEKLIRGTENASQSIYWIIGALQDPALVDEVQADLLHAAAFVETARLKLEGYRGE